MVGGMREKSPATFFPPGTSRLILEGLYDAFGLSIRDMAQALHVSPSRVHRALKQWGIPLRGRGRRPRL